MALLSLCRRVAACGEATYPGRHCLDLVVVDPPDVLKSERVEEAEHQPHKIHPEKYVKHFRVCDDDWRGDGGFPKCPSGQHELELRLGFPQRLLHGPPGSHERCH